jgi:hypothetical protein
MQNGDCKKATFWFTKDWLQLPRLSGELAGAFSKNCVSVKSD